MNFEQIFINRRAINYFNPDKPIDPALVKKMVEMAAKSPSSFNLQPWSLIPLITIKDKLRLQKCAMNQAKVSEAPVTMIVLADDDGYKEGNRTVERVFQENIKAGLMTEKQRDWFVKVRTGLYGKNEKVARGFSAKNSGFFAMSLMLAAKSLGIDSHPMDGFDHDKVMEEFKIPENYYIPLLISFGYFDETKTLAEPKWRKGYDDILIRFDE